MWDIGKYVRNDLLSHSLLTRHRERLSIALSGSRAVGYQRPSSDYDFLILTDTETYGRIAELSGKPSSAKGIEICRNSQEGPLGEKVDAAVQDAALVASAFDQYNDVVLWIWTNAKPIADESGAIQRLRNSFPGYPRDVLACKLKRHFLMDFHLSVHGLTYQSESKNIFSVIHALSSKIAEMCTLCCLLDGKPFPYEKWLFHAAEDTHTGKNLAPIFTRVLATLTSLNNDLVANWGLIQEAIASIDTEACDILEQALVTWGLDSEWVKNAYDNIEDAIFEL